MKTGGNRPRCVRARRKRAGIDRIYAVARQTSRSRAFTTGAGRCSFTERGEEKRRRRRRPCFLAAEAEAEACRSLLESTGRAHLPRVRPCISSWLLESTRGPSAPHLLARLRRPSVVSLGLVAPCLLSASSRHRHPHLTCPSASSRRPQVHPHRTCPSASCLRLRLVCPLPPLCLWSPKGQLPGVYSCSVICSSCSAFALNIVCLVLCCSAFDLNIVCLVLCY